MTIGEKLLEQRKRLNMTQEGVASLLGVSRQTISNWELNQTAPDLAQAKKISELFHISIDELVDNNVKDVLTSKVSNTEKLAGLIYKILKWFIVGLVVVFALMLGVMIFGSVLFMKSDDRSTTIVKNSITMQCVVDGKTYSVFAEEMNDKLQVVNSDFGDLIEIDQTRYNRLNDAVNDIRVKVELIGGECD